MLPSRGRLTNIALLLSLPLASAGDVQSPALYNCQPNYISWTGTPPFHVMFLDPNDHSVTVFDLGWTYKYNVSWDCPLDPGTVVQVKVTGDDGYGFSGPRTIRDDCPKPTSSTTSMRTKTTLETISAEPRTSVVTSKDKVELHDANQHTSDGMDAHTSSISMTASSSSAMPIPSHSISSIVSSQDALPSNSAPRSAPSAASSIPPNLDSHDGSSTAPDHTSSSTSSDSHLSLTLGLSLGVSSLIGFGIIALILYRRLFRQGDDSTSGSFIDHFHNPTKGQQVELWMDRNQKLSDESDSDLSGTMSRRTSLISSSNARRQPRLDDRAFLPCLAYDGIASPDSAARSLNVADQTVGRNPSTPFSASSASPSSCALPTSGKWAPPWRRPIKGFVPRSVLTESSFTRPAGSMATSSMSPEDGLILYHGADQGHRTAPSIQDPTPYGSIVFDRPSRALNAGVPLSFGDLGSERGGSSRSETESFGSR